MTFSTVLAWVFGAGAMAALFTTYQQKTRKGTILAKMAADVCWALHYLFLGAYAGIIPNAMGILRENIFLQRGKRKWADSILWPILFVVASWLIGLRTFHSWYNTLPMFASLFATIGLWNKDPRVTKALCFPASACFLVYDIFVHSYVGIANESVGLISIIIYFVRMWNKPMFTVDCKTDKELIITPGAVIENPAATITAAVSDEAVKKGDAFAQEITDRFVADFEKPGDQMAHVSTFVVMGDTVYISYYANTYDPAEDPEHQTARLAWAPVDNTAAMEYIDLQTIGDKVDGRTVDMVYDTILMQKDDKTIYVMWTARVEENYYRFYCPFNTVTKTLGKIGVNRFKVGNTVNDFSVSGIKGALAAEGVPCKHMYSDIGIMQKLSSRVENGETYYYSGTYSGDFTCVIKSKDLITWEYVSQPDFINASKWENATYVLGDKVFYFVRQQDQNPCGFLTVYDLTTGTWAPPVEVEDCQSRGDFILYRGELYLVHAPIDRDHIGLLHINTEDITKTEVVLQAKMHTSCFYPFIQYYRDGELAMSYTVARQHIRLAEFTLENYL